MKSPNCVDSRYADAPRITLVCEQLEHATRRGRSTKRSRPDQAREYVRRINFVYTPKHGSWLNVAECELSCLTSQCLSRPQDRRDCDPPIRNCPAWADPHQRQANVPFNWQFTIEKSPRQIEAALPENLVWTEHLAYPAG